MKKINIYYIKKENIHITAIKYLGIALITIYSFQSLQMRMLVEGDINNYSILFDKIRNSENILGIVTRYEPGFVLLSYAFSNFTSNNIIYLLFLSSTQAYLFISFYISFTTKIPRQNSLNIFLIISAIFIYFCLLHTRFGLSGLRSGLAYSIIIWSFLLKSRAKIAFISVLAFSIHFSCIIFIIVRILSLISFKKNLKYIYFTIPIGIIMVKYVLDNAHSVLLEELLSVPSVNISIGFLVALIMFFYLYIDKEYLKLTFGRSLFNQITIFTLLAISLSLINTNTTIDRTLDLIKVVYLLVFILIISRSTPKYASLFIVNLVGMTYL